MRASISQIVLAQEPDFTLGGLTISPSKLQVVSGELGSAERGRALLQPRIMQVFVALARRRGEVVSRDEMMAVCWGGFAVSDDAINRCIARIRRLSQNQGGFTLETIPRVGYQLNETCLPEQSPLPETDPLIPAEASFPAPQAPGEVAESARAGRSTVRQSWVAQHGVVAAIAFVAGVLASAAAFAGAHLF